MDHPTPEQLTSAVAAARASLMPFDPDAANDAAVLSGRVRDDHFAWKRGADEDAVRAVLERLKLADPRPYAPPAEPFPRARMFPARALAWERVEALGDAGALPVVGVHHSQGGVGSKGTYFLCVAPEDEVAVLKEAPLDFATEVMGAALCRRAGALRAPRYRRLSRAEFGALTERLRDAPVTVAGTCGALHESRAQGAGAALMELMSGVPLPEVGAGLAQTDAFLRDLGAVIAVDMLINNFDRTPLVWTHRGNASNLLVDEAGCSAIDQAVTPILDAANEAKYVAKIRECLAEARAAAATTTGTAGPFAKRLIGFVADASGAELSLAHTRAVFQSLVETAAAIKADAPALVGAAASEAEAAMRAGLSDAELGGVRDALARAKAFCARVAANAL